VTGRQLPLRLQLGADEADRHDAVLLGCSQEPLACPVPGSVVLKGHLTEPREGIPDVRRVVDREAPFAARIDVREVPVG
jgi:hypothetical protein